MEPDPLSLKYISQAQTLLDFMKNIENNQCDAAQYKIMLQVICKSYYELLVSLANLNAYSSEEPKSLMSNNKYDLNNPPLEKDFFNNHRI
jgi:hypothetical protein